MEENKRRPLPGDKDYPGGIFKTRVYTQKGNYEITTIKDSYGNVVSVFERPLVFGIF